MHSIHSTSQIVQHFSLAKLSWGYLHFRFRSKMLILDDHIYFLKVIYPLQINTQFVQISYDISKLSLQLSNTSMPVWLVVNKNGSFCSCMQYWLVLFTWICIRLKTKASAAHDRSHAVLGKQKQLCTLFPSVNTNHTTLLT